MKALEGIRILDLSQKLTMSLATMYLGAYGAEVIKVESPEVGDRARTWEPMMPQGSLYFNYLNSGKKSITLNYREEAGANILKKLVRTCDVICVNEMAGTMEALGLGYEDLCKEKPDLVYAAYSYYGETGPWSKKPGSSLTAQAKGVAMDMTGVVGEYPVQSAPSTAEHYSAGYIATGIVMGVMERNMTGNPQKVDIALLDSIFSCIEAAPAAFSTVGEIHTRKGNFDPSCAPYDTFEAADGYVAIGIATQMQWENFCDAMDMVDLKEDPRFADNELRRGDYMDGLRPVLAERLISWSKFDVEQTCRKKGVPCCAVLTIPEITDLPNTLENGYMTVFESPRFGHLRYPAVPFVLSETPAAEFADAPVLGENTEEILAGI